MVFYTLLGINLNLNRMKNIIVVCAIGCFAILGCSESPKGDKAVITEEKATTPLSGTTFIVDTAESNIRFTGHGIGKNHPGTFKLSNGSVAVENNQITGGKFTIDIKTLVLEQKGEMFDKKLRPHLMSGDFFDAEKFENAAFEITNVSVYESNDNDTSIVEGANFLISGNFTLKDVTKNISFPAKVVLEKDNLKANGNFDIDRTQWQMNYGNDKTLGDKFISETVNIELDLEAKLANQ